MLVTFTTNAYADITLFEEVALAILDPAGLRALWPAALAQRIDNQVAHVIHVPFKKAPLLDAIPRFDHNNYPNGGGHGHYTREAHQQWGLL